MTTEPPSLPEVSASGPREVRIAESMQSQLRKIKGVLITLVVFSTAMVLFFGKQSDDLAQKGVVLDAKVIELRARPSGGKTSFEVDYTYAYQGYPFFGEKAINDEEYNRLRVGATVPITILPDAPSTPTYGRVTAERGGMIRKSGSLLVLAMSSMGAVQLMALQARIRKERKVLERWPAVPGRALEVTPIPQRSGRALILRYETWLPDGRVLQRSQRVMTDEKHMPKVGDVFAVFLTPEIPPDRSEMYPRSALSSAEVVSGNSRPS